MPSQDRWGHQSSRMESRWILGAVVVFGKERVVCAGE